MTFQDHLEEVERVAQVLMIIMITKWINMREEGKSIFILIIASILFKNIFSSGESLNRNKRRKSHSRENERREVSKSKSNFFK